MLSQWATRKRIWWLRTRHLFRIWKGLQKSFCPSMSNSSKMKGTSKAEWRKASGRLQKPLWKARGSCLLTSLVGMALWWMATHSTTISTACLVDSKEYQSLLGNLCHLGLCSKRSPKRKKFKSYRSKTSLRSRSRTIWTRWAIRSQGLSLWTFSLLSWLHHNSWVALSQMAVAKGKLGWA